MKARTTIIGEDSGAPAVQGPLSVRLLVIGPRSYEAYELPSAGTVTIGRAESNDVCIEDAQASRTHARLVISDTIWIEDLGSVNGTRVRGRPIGRGERVAVHPGEAIAIGSSVAIVHLRSAMVAERLTSDSTTYDQVSLADASRLASRPGEAKQTIMRLAERAAAGPINVLILGETGVGKDVMAGTIHRLSPRRDAAYVCLNCAALSETLLESELFGHEKGAFTGALFTKPGLIETASGGTLFLDEVGELPLPTQAKLLRVIETREVTRLGSVKPRKIDFRFLSATNRDLESDVERGSFRLDLYFRLNAMSIRIPPLRERRGEIPALADTFLRDACAELGRPLLEISPHAMTALVAKPWLGNIRELKNVIERAVLLCIGSEIGLEHLPDERLTRSAQGVVHSRHRTGPQAASGAGVRAAKDAVRMVGSPQDVPATEPTGGGARREARHSDRETPDEERPIRAIPDAPAGLSAAQLGDRARMVEALRACAGNQSRAARMLGIPRRTFVARLDRYGIPRPKKGLGTRGRAGALVAIAASEGPGVNDSGNDNDEADCGA